MPRNSRFKPSSIVKPRPPTWVRGSSSSTFRFDQVAGLVGLYALAATSLLGMPAAALFILMSLFVFALNPEESGKAVLKFSPLLLLPLLAMMSTIWSDAPQRTMRAAIQLLLTMVAALLIARKLGASKVVLTLYIAFIAITVTALPFIPQSLSSGRALQGFYASKNALGTGLQMVFALGLAVAVDRTQPTVARISTIVVIPITLGMLWLTQSATAQVSVAITLLLFPLLLLFGKVPLSGRYALAIIALLLLGLALVLLPVILDAIADFRKNVLNKDATLTGRTYLWEYAARLTAERPLLGHGYYAFWRQGNLDAEGLWRWGGIAARTGFNFHNAFVEMKVDLGYIGQILLIATCAISFAAGLFRQLTRPSPQVAFFVALQVVMYVRSYAETGLISPFSALTALWVAACVYAFTNDGQSRTEARTRQPSRRPRRQFWRDNIAS